MAVFYYCVLLAVVAFWLGACPFSVWIGEWLLHKDIRQYGDGNPGAFNVFRAGGRKAGVLAVVLDIGKGIPFVAMAHYQLGLPTAAVMVVGLSAILGHAYTPFLRFKGGKALAVTGGVLIALPQHEILVSVLIFLALSSLLVIPDAWRVICGMTGSLAYLAVSQGLSLEPLFMVCVMAILVAKHFEDLKVMPRFGGKLGSRLRPRRTRV